MAASAAMGVAFAGVLGLKWWADRLCPKRFQPKLKGDAANRDGLAEVWAE